MPIQAKCRKCSKVYTVKDELAGKKFRCKQCEAPVTVPQPAVLLEVEDEFGDDFSGGFDDDFGGDEEFERPVSRPKKKKGTAKKKGKKRSSGPGMGAKIATIGGGIFGGLIVLSVVLKIVVGLVNNGGLPSFASWKTYTSPDGMVSVSMPGDPKPMRTGPFVRAGSTVVGVEKPRFATAIMIESVPPEITALSQDQVRMALEQGVRMMGGANVEIIDINGQMGVSYEKKSGEITLLHQGFMKGDKAYTLVYMHKGSSPGSDKDKFFKSLKIK